jgi:2-oxoglutarate dehydrogenase E1 component
MGPWLHVADRFRRLTGQETELEYAGRPESASTATGYHDVHAREQRDIVRKALAG